MKIYGGTKAMKRKIVVALIEDAAMAGALCFGGLLALRFAAAVLRLLGAG